MRNIPILQRQPNPMADFAPPPVRAPWLHEPKNSDDIAQFEPNDPFVSSSTGAEDVSGCVLTA